MTRTFKKGDLVWITLPTSVKLTKFNRSVGVWEIHSGLVIKSIHWQPFVEYEILVYEKVFKLFENHVFPSREKAEEYINESGKNR